MRLRTLALLGASAAILAAASADAQVVYDNGPINGPITAWTLYSAQYVTESFTLDQTTTITGFTFGGFGLVGGALRNRRRTTLSFG